MDLTSTVGIAGLILAVAFLYSSVGHAGASGYLAVMALFGLAPATMKPTALALNILVAAIGTVKFYKAGYFSWSIFWPFAVGAIPFAFVGGRLTLPSTTYKVVVGLILLFAAFRLFRTTRQQKSDITPLPLGIALCSGVIIGFLSGLTGVGGGIFLSPLLLYMGWAGLRTISGVSAAFILVNSISGLLGHVTSVTSLPASIPIWAAAAGVGGWIGAEYGSRKFSTTTLTRLLSAVLVVAGLKLIFT
jgi:uncharacterized membrane protein YfcA